MAAPAGIGLQPGPVRADGAILPDSLSPDYLAVRYHHVTVDIEDGHAVTQVEQEFYNPHPVVVEVLPDEVTSFPPHPQSISAISNTGNSLIIIFMASFFSIINTI